MNLKGLGLVCGLVLAAPFAAIAAPASGLTAHSYIDVATTPQATSGAAVAPGEATAKIEKVWWRGRGFGPGFYGRRFGGFYGPRFRFYRRPFFGYYRYRRPFFRRRFFYY